MNNETLMRGAESLRRQTRWRLWQKIVGVMACVVVFCTTYALILPAITMKSTSYCGLEEHVHGEACYEQQLICGLSTEPEEAHVHGEECYAQESVLICQKEETEGHVHTEECTGIETVLSCELEEREGHTHDETCMEETEDYICGQEECEGHTHSDECYTEAVVNVCGLEEIEPHTHTEECYQLEDKLVCELSTEPEEPHVHDDSCYTSVFVCQLEEHTHGLICYSDRTADVETAEVWEKTLPETLNGVWAEDLLAVAGSQLGYVESTANYNVTETGEVKGYSRYGDWFGDTYGDWCAMFVSFCLNYAQIPQDTVPYEANCQAWIALLTEKEMYVQAVEYTPVPGDLIFFDNDGDGISDHVGIVRSISEEEGQITTIEGNSADCVRSVVYAADDAVILGYGVLQGQLMEETAVDSEVAEVIALIDAMPSADEIDEKLAEFEDAEDYEGEEAWYMEVFQQVIWTYRRYSELSEDQKAQVSNAEKLLELEYIWSAVTLDLESTDTVNVTAVNAYGYEKGCGAVIIHNDSGTTVGNSGIGESSFAWWYAIVIEKEDGYFKVKEIYSSGEGQSKSEVYASGDGFILLYHEDNLGASVNVKIGQYAALSSTFWKTASAYTGTVYGTVTFGDTIPASLKAEKDNSNNLTIVESADTSQLIEVNLYDYDSKINTLHNADNKYPGFQQDKGTRNVDSTLDFGSFNFGNNITSDLDAGIAGLTNSGGTINQTASTYGGIEYGTANIPIEGAVSKKLIGGYPALADGTSLSYLFSDSTYATKKNTANINGLFRYDAETGEYSFNSRENHAQFDASQNTFTLYKQIISSNFMMYPFGNFLPFNDIVKLSKQASTIDRSYFQTIADSAAYKAAQGYGTEYETLAAQLNQFISLMDANYGTGWDSYNAVNAYFTVAGISAYFSGTDPKLPDGTPLMQDLYSIDYDEPTDFYFGMDMKMELLQPKGGMTGPNGKEPMEFYFTGDDDVWVYLDGALFLDLTGIHRHVGGKIDFVNGKIYYYNLDTGTGDVDEVAYKTVTFQEAFEAAYAAGSEELADALAGLNEKGTFKDYSKHTFNFYYMERGAGSGICRMNFNFPLLHSISVTKELTVDDTDVTTLLGDEPVFSFQIWKEGETELFIGPGTSYKLVEEDGTSTTTGITDSNGIFTLYAGQTAVFDGIEQSAGRYFVRELLDEDTFGQYGQVEVDGQVTMKDSYRLRTVGTETFEGVDSPVRDIMDGNTVFTFNNTVTVSELGSLTITKALQNADAEDGQTFDFTVTLDGEEKTVSVSPGTPVTIENILLGTTYAVQEAEASAAGYTVIYKVDGREVTGPATGTISSNTTVEVEVINSKDTSDTASIEIPVNKELNVADQTGRTYQFKMVEVEPDESLTWKEVKALESAEAAEKSVTLKEAISESAVFYVNYSSEGVHYYQITETVGSDTDTKYDASVYIVEVTVSPNADDKLEAGITRVWKDGTKLTEDQPQITFTNVLVGDLTISKEIRGSSLEERKFSFEITFKQNGNLLTGDYFYTKTTENSTSYESEKLNLIDGVVTMELENGDSITISDLPLGVFWSVKETAGDDFIAAYKVDENDLSEGSQVEGTVVSAGSKVHFVNSICYELPKTGGSGKCWYIFGGVFLMAASLLIYKMRKRKDII